MHLFRAIEIIEKVCRQREKVNYHFMALLVYQLTDLEGRMFGGGNVTVYCESEARCHCWVYIEHSPTGMISPKLVFDMYSLG
jgi:hypothetical protein